MAIVLSGIQVELDDPFEKAAQLAQKQLKVRPQDVAAIYPVKSSVDARHPDHIKIVYSVGIELLSDEERALHQANLANGALRQKSALEISRGTRRMEQRPVIVGFGPAGMFAALLLAQYGYRPLVLERGLDVDARVRAVEGFWQSGILDEQTNVQFGEGGAGTFSDGKLTTRIHDPRCGYVMEQLAHFGAPAETMRRAKPHIGTDHLRAVVKNIRREIERLGGEIRFGAQAEDLLIRDGRLTGIRVGGQELPCRQLVLAVGHSARDTFQMLMKRQIPMIAKAFSVGVRIEQLQSAVDQGLYGKFAGHPALDKGEYQLSHREGERGVYTFCMCPGGVVVPSASEPESVVTNGMSEYARNGKNANAALVVSVDGKDFGSNPEDGIAFQRRLEQAAFAAGGGHYMAPGQTAKSFLDQSAPAMPDSLEPSYALGVEPYRLEMLFPDSVSRMLGTGLRKFERRIPGFSGSNAFLTGVETRTSSPVRILREEDFQSPALKGLYPCGEGAGYAGGIVSAAVDGVRVAQEMIAQWAPIGE
ncbi:MAG: hypothetical protein PHE47_06630 [Oscillospiraceae bacterium]|nr:hypothetical protein [Oscillospiraceae bacterium]